MDHRLLLGALVASPYALLPLWAWAVYLHGRWGERFSRRYTGEEHPPGELAWLLAAAIAWVTLAAAAVTPAVVVAALTLRA